MLIRTEWKQKILSEAIIVSAEIDTSGLKVKVNCSKEVNDPSGSVSSFKVKVVRAASPYTINKISLDPANSKIFIIELKTPVLSGKDILLSYLGTIRATDSSVLAPVTDLTIKNNSLKTAISSFNKMDCTIFPNPCSDQLEVSSSVKMDNIRIFDITGKSVLEMRNIAQTKKQISLTNFPQGMYFLCITSANSTAIEKLLKK
jgi:hypothetical protein